MTMTTPSAAAGILLIDDGELDEVAEGVFLLPGFGNCTILSGKDGIAIVDPGLFMNGPRVVGELRKISDAPVRYIIYTHGHYDHAFGTPAILEDAEAIRLRPIRQTQGYGGQLGLTLVSREETEHRR